MSKDYAALIQRKCMTVLRRIYAIAITPARPRILRAFCMSIVVLVLCLRCARLAQPLIRPLPVFTVLLCCFIVGVVPLLVSAFASLLVVVYRHPEDGIGHRVGAEGYHGEYFENTLEALRELAARDARGELDGKHLPFIEFDVQETSDHHLVVFHDPVLTRAFPDAGPNVAPLAALRSAGVDTVAAAVRDVTLAQLLTLHLGGREGIQVPTLHAFLR
jgi:hypothetical protein